MRKKIVFIVIISLFLAISFMYHSVEIKRIETSLAELTLVVARPMWNYDTERLDRYLEAVTERYQYQSLRIINDNNSVFYAGKSKEVPWGERLLSQVGMIPKVVFEKEIIYEDRVLGKIIVTWRDTSIYFYSYTFVISLLLIVIANLYERVLVAKKDLEGKIHETQKALIELQSQKEYIEGIFNVIPEGLLTIDQADVCIGNNLSFDTMVSEWAETLDKDRQLIRERFLTDLRNELLEKEHGQYSMKIDGYIIHIEYSSASIRSDKNIHTVVSLRDVTKIVEMKRQLSHTQKLEAVGRLAAGIAHEINTPTQYVMANTEFLIESHKEVADVMSQVEKIVRSEKKSVGKLIAELKASFDEIDWDFLQEEIPDAQIQSQEGLRRITKIVSAMKHFSHPSGDTPECNDINNAIENTVAVSTNEWKLVANVDLQLDPSLPRVPCFLDELNQVFLIIIVNSAHAIEEKYSGQGGAKGTITIKTFVGNNEVLVTIRDDGMGIPKSVREKVFDPFFTTKELNKGTGQGLAIAHDVIVNRHKGKISVESESGVGSTFSISLPLAENS